MLHQESEEKSRASLEKESDLIRDGLNSIIHSEVMAMEHGFVRICSRYVLFVFFFSVKHFLIMVFISISHLIEHFKTIVF